MKNLARVLSLVLVLSMLVSSVAFAGTFTDVEAGSTYAEATSVLSDLGIILGYEDGTFGPDKVITRAEVVAVVNRLQGLSDAAKAAGGTTAYTDVAADAWYAGDVNLATQMGIISGDGNGLFRPEDQVKYEEAVKMMVAACGYTQQYALSRGGWPTGYLVIATEQGITKGMSESAGAPAYRGIVAKLAYQALTAPMMVLTSTDTDGVDRFAPDAKTILLEKRLETHKLSGYVSANTVSVIDGASTTEAGVINYTMTAEKVGKYIDKFAYTAGLVNTVNGILVGDTDVASTLGVATDIYVAENADGKYEVVSYVIQTAKTNTVVIENTADIQAVNNSVYTGKVSKWNASEKYLAVYNADTDTSAKQYLLEDDVTLLVNDAKVSGVFNADGSYVAKYIGTVNSKNIVAATNQGLGLVYAPNAGSVELVDIDNNGKYDTIKVASYETVIMEDDPYANNTMIATSAGTINLDFANKEKASYSITLDGEKADIADLKKDDVLSIAMTNADNWVILASRATVEGQISELDTTGTADEWQFVIDGKTYTLANCADITAIKLSASTQAGAEGIFYLDAFGNIALYDETSSASKNYGFIVAAGEYSSVGDVEYEVRILDKDGNTNTYVLAENVRVDGATTATAAGTVFTNDIASKAFYKAATGGTYNAVWTFKTVSGAPEAGLLQADKATPVTTVGELVANYTNRIITYTVNSTGKVTAINFVGSAKVDLVTGLGTYKAKTGAFSGSYGVAEDAVIFNLPISNTSSKDDFKVTAVSALEDDETYVGAMYNLNDDQCATALVITSDSATVGADKNLAVVLKAMTANNANGERVINLTFLQGGEEKTLATTEDVAGTYTFNKGDVFEYSTDASGAIDKVANQTAIASLKNSALLQAWDETPGAPKAQYVFGAVYAKNAGSRTITLAQYNVNAVSVNNAINALGRNIIPDDAVVTVIDCAKSNTAANKVVAGAFGDIQATRWINATTVDEYSDYAVLIKYYKEEVVDVVVYKNFANQIQK